MSEYEEVRKRLIMEVQEVLQHPVWKKMHARKGGLRDARAVLKPEEIPFYADVLLPKLRKRMEKLKMWDAVHGVSKWDK